jgi:integrase
MPKAHTQKYRKQKRSSGDLAFVVLNNVRHYLGRYGSNESRQAYHRLLAQWSSNAQQLPVSASEITIVELAARFLVYAADYYRKPDGVRTPETKNFKPVIQMLKDLYGHEKVCAFGPLALKTLRAEMVKKDWSRTYINKQVDRVKRIFRWGVAEEIVTSAVYQALTSVPGLKRGRCQARETMRVKPVSETDIEAVRQHVSPQVWAMIQLQVLTGSRSGEIVSMRVRDVNVTGPVWTYRPECHKTSHHGHDRIIFIGPRAQSILSVFMEGKTSDEFVFSVSEAERDRRKRRFEARRTPMSCGNTPRLFNNMTCKRAPRGPYSQASYRRSIARACEKAKIPAWHPHQLRHNAGTEFRRAFGIEAAQLLLGHKNVSATEIYAETNLEKAISVAQRIG